MEQEEQKPAEQTPAPAKSKGGYGKRPLWQWILLYLVVGGILYYLIYILFFSHGYSYKY